MDHWKGTLLAAAWLVLLIAWNVADVYFVPRALTESVRDETSLWFFGGVVLASAVCISLILIATIAILIFSKWTRPQVFVAYNRERLDTAEQIVRSLNLNGIHTYIDRPGLVAHDQLIDRLRKQINRSDMVVVLPGATASFVDAEILSASTAEKLMVVIALSGEDTLPNTMLCGYPTFQFESLASKTFTPLADFVFFAVNHRKYTMASLLEAFAAGMAVYFSPLGTTVLSVTVILGYFTYRWAFRSSELLLAIIFGLATSMFIIVASKQLIAVTRASRIIRQQSITGTGTVESISKLAPHYLNEAVECLRAEPLGFRYAVPAT
jgi:hypothetical protein